MTRVNMGIPVRCLTDEHLLAEHREIKRIPQVYVNSLRSGSIGRIPKSFCLGKGHVLFFVDKPRYTLSRYRQLHRECLRRGFNVEDYSSNWNCYPKRMFDNATRSSVRIVTMLVSRISERVLSSPKRVFHYYGVAIKKTDAIKLLHYAENKI